MQNERENQVVRIETVPFTQQAHSMPPERLEDDIEVVNLDEPRNQIKPTTWHQAINRPAIGA